jgi:uncharacterized membrane protein YhaH (DUF805 family)
MGFGEAISSGFRNYVGFSGRAARSEYWYWVLFSIICQVVAVVIDKVLFGYGTSALEALVGLALLLPGLAVVVRRLHDLDRSGWFFLLGFIPLIGAIWLLVWFCTKGTWGSNRFGPDPLGQDVSRPTDAWGQER